MKLRGLLFRNGALLTCLGVIVAQQLTVAVGTFLMGSLAHAWVAGIAPIEQIVTLIFCLVLPGSLFHYFVARTYANAQNSILERYLHEYVKNAECQPTNWKNAETVARTHDIMTKEAQDTIWSAVHFSTDVCATLLNVVFNAIAVATVTDPWLGGAALLSGALGAAAIQLADRRISVTVNAETIARNDLQGFMSRSWDSIAIGNQRVLASWADAFKTKLRGRADCTNTATHARELAVCSASAITSAAMLGAMLYTGITHAQDAAIIAALFVMMPRCLQIVMHAQVLQSYLADWKSLRERLRIIESSIELQPRRELEKWIDEGGISIVGSDGTTLSLKELASLCHNGGVGRYTVRGGNGVGKSSLLLTLKDSLAAQAFYLPAQHNLFDPATESGKSSGEMAMHFLDVALSGDEPVLLLDEWSANLTDENAARYDALIFRASTGRAVVEVLHSSLLGAK